MANQGLRGRVWVLRWVLRHLTNWRRRRVAHHVRLVGIGVLRRRTASDGSLTHLVHSISLVVGMRRHSAIRLSSVHVVLRTVVCKLSLKGRMSSV